MKKRLYKDAVKVLLKQTEGVPASSAARQYLMLGECYYLLEQYAEARPYFAQAKSHLKADDDLIIAEYRLACVAYRMGDVDGAIDQIDAFERKHPNDSRLGTLLVFKMKILARKGKPAQDELERIHRRLSAEGARASSATALAADRVLTDFYVAIGESDKAKREYASIVHNARNLIAQNVKDKTNPPVDVQQAHDNAAMQLAVIAVNENQNGEAVRWLENIKYDADLVRRAALLLAQIAYQQQDFDRAISSLTGSGLLDGALAEPLRSDVNLILGFSMKNRKTPDLQKAADYLEKVSPGAKGYAQAQAGLGDMYREKGFADRAIKAYTAAIDSPAYAPHALLELGRIYLAQAEEAGSGPRQADSCRKAAAMLSQLGTKYPLSREAKQSQESVETLLKKGYDVSSAVSEDEKARQWQKTATDKPGSAEALQSLMSLIRYYLKTVAEEKSGRYLKAPNYVACAEACDRLLDPAVYNGKGLAADAWQNLQCEALYSRACSQLASLSPADAPKEGLTPLYLKKADLEKAIADFVRAKSMVDPKQLEMVKSIELGLLEAMLKSDKKEHREAAEKRFSELANEYGADPRFQKLAMDLAEWYRAQGRLADAAREYKGIADRGKSLSRDDLLKALYMAGSLYSTAAADAREKPGQAGYAIYIYPEEVLKIGDPLKAYPPLQKVVQVAWPKATRQGPVTAAQALARLSQASGVPLVWSSDKGREGVANTLNTRAVSLEDGRATVEEFLRRILPVEYRLDFDLGLTGGTPTISPAPPKADAGEAAAPVRVIEIYDPRLWEKRYPPLTREYGTWKNTHGKSEMMFNILRRIEDLGRTKIVWADGVEKRDIQAVEYKEVPGVSPTSNASCASVLARVLEPLHLRYRIIQRDLAGEWYEEAKNCFNEIRKIEPRSKYGEKSLFILALNYQQQHELERMKIVLKEYLKTFDRPGSEHYHEACFWVGWALEQEGKLREACGYYSRAAEECLVVYRPAAGAKPPSRDEWKKQLAHEALVALEEPVSGEFKDLRLDPDIFEFVRINTNVKVRLDAGAAPVDASVSRPAFHKRPCLDVLFDVLDGLGLAVRVENLGKTIADKAYYRLASCYEREGQHDLALEACNALLTRFPETTRKRDAYKLKLEIHKGLKDYRNVLATLRDLKDKCGQEVEGYQQDFEMGWIYFDLCRYDKAVEHLARALADAKDSTERTKIRDGYARALVRAGDAKEALAQYETLVAEETEPLRKFVDEIMAAHLKSTQENLPQDRLPEYAEKLIVAYESLGDAKRALLPKADLAKVTWIYYVLALTDLRMGREAPAMQKLTASANSPDDSLAAESSYLLGTIYLKQNAPKQAREVLEDLLFSARSTEAEVKALYALAQCHHSLGDTAKAVQRLKQLMDRFPDSPYADQARAHPLWPKDAAAPPTVLPDAGTAGSGK